MKFHSLVYALFLLPSLFGDVFQEVKIPPEKVKAIRSLSDLLTGAGFPNSKGGEFYLGDVQVLSTVDPDKHTPPFPISTSNMQSTVPSGNRIEYGFEFSGLHLKHLDGSWVLGLYNTFEETAQNEIRMKSAKLVKTDQIFAAAQKETLFDLAEASPEWVKSYKPTDRAFMVSVVNKAAPISMYLELHANDVPLTLLFLHNGGMQEAPLLAYLVADTRARDFWQLSYWNSAPAPFDPSGRYPGLQEMERQWHDQRKEGYELEEVDVALRRALHRAFRNMVIHSGSFLSAAKAAELAKLCVDPGDPQGNSLKIDHILKAVQIEDSPVDGASLEERIRAWGLPKKPEMVVRQGEGSKGGMSMQTLFITPKAAYTPDIGDLDGLFALLTDTGPSKYIDFQGSRTVGENSMRALAHLLNRNPLELVDMEALEPWTLVRSNEAAHKLQTWWAENKQDVSDYILKDE